MQEKKFYVRIFYEKTKMLKQISLVIKYNNSS